MFFNGWDGPIRVLVVGFLAYLGLIFMLRVTGNRTLSQLNSFDFIITVAMGSALSAVMLQKSVPLVDGLFALFLLIMLQYVLTKLAVKSNYVDTILKTSPSILFFQGRFLRENMQKDRVTEEEILSSIRKDGLSNIEDVEAVVLESNGKLSTIPRSSSNNGKDETKSYHYLKENLKH